MPDTNSSILGLLLMGDGLHTNDWGDATNANLSLIEQAIKGITTLTLGGGPVTVTQAQSACSIILLTGVLTSNATLTFQEQPGFWNILNQTTGAFSVTLQAAGDGTSIVIPQGQNRSYLTDGTNFYDASPQTDIVPVGAVIGYPSLTPPNANYHLIDGTLLQVASYPVLASKIGTTWGGDGVTTVALPDFNGRSMFSPDNGSNRLNGLTLGQYGGSAAQTLAITNLPAHAHGVNDPTHSHGVNDPSHGHELDNFGATRTGVVNPGGDFILARGGTSFVDNSVTGIFLSNAATGVSIQNTGSGTAFSILPPLGIMPLHMRIQ